MANFYINTEKTIDSSLEIIIIATKLKELRDNLEKVKLSGILDSSCSSAINASLKKIRENILNEAVKMNSMGDALELIVNKYKATETAIGNMQFESAIDEEVKEKSAEVGSDKRNLLNKFWDWITRKEPDEYDTTSFEQEKAADTAMKKELWKVLQDEKYSQENWDNASIEERKQILQDYMNEVIKIYGLQDVKPNIVWDSDATYTAQSITWGYYTHGRHTVTLNEQALTDNVGTWDSYELLETVSHELRHAYQHEAINHPTEYMVSKETIKIWKKNFRNYISSDDDYEKYRNQAVEVDARDFQVSRDDRV